MSPADICHYALVNGGDVLAAAAAGPLEISMAAGSPRKQDEVAFSEHVVRKPLYFMYNELPTWATVHSRFSVGSD